VADRFVLRPVPDRRNVFKYRLHSPDGDDLGEATYAMMIHAGEEIHLTDGQRFRVVDVVRFDEEDEVAVRRDAEGRSGSRQSYAKGPGVPG